MRTKADISYHLIVGDLLSNGEEVTTRNNKVYRNIHQHPITFTSAPLVTLRNVAVKKALLELEWFLSGDDECPEHLRDWWDGQLDEDGCYNGGYAHQLKYWFDQVAYVVDGLINQPYSRRLCFSAWCTDDMANISLLNDNPNTPATCHLSFVQFFVDGNKKVHMKQYQRSCDVLLGLQHNWMQHWALLTYVAKRAKLDVGSYTWIGGDVHLYNEPSHIDVAKTISNWTLHEGVVEVGTEYLPSSEEFRADDFAFDKSKLSKPITTVRPKLL
jgi:thymidylate synthase